MPIQTTKNKSDAHTHTDEKKLKIVEIPTFYTYTYKFKYLLEVHSFAAFVKRYTCTHTFILQSFMLFSSTSSFLNFYYAIQYLFPSFFFALVRIHNFFIVLIKYPHSPLYASLCMRFQLVVTSQFAYCFRVIANATCNVHTYLFTHIKKKA